MTSMTQQIFPQQSTVEKILFLRKKEWDIYYSSQHKWPYLVIQELGYNIGRVNPGEYLIRQERQDPFMPDPDIPAEYSLTQQDYENYKLFGGSPGHNAPASQHKTTIAIFDQTFLYSNVTPQEIMFNSGAWVILENWVKQICKNPVIKKSICITGSIPDVRTTRLGASQINIPTHMFKIFAARPKLNPDLLPTDQWESASNTIYIACFLYPNIPINPTPKNVEIWRYMVSITELEALTGFNFMPILVDKLNYSQGVTQLVNLSKLMSVEFLLSHDLEVQMTRSYMYGLLIYSTTLEELDRNWLECEKHTGEFKYMQFHREYYDLAKARILSGDKLVIPHVTDNKSGLFLHNIV